MGEGVSLSPHGKGVPGASHLPAVISVSTTRDHDSYVVFVSFSREHSYLDGCILLVYRSANGAGFLVPDTREHGSDPFPRDHDLFDEINMPSLKEAAGVDLGYGQDSGHRDLAFPAQASQIGDVKGVKALPKAEKSSITKPMSFSVSSGKGMDAVGTPRRDHISLPAIRTDITIYFPPLRLDKGVDPKEPMSHLVQTKLIGKEMQCTRFHRVGVTSEQKDVDLPRTNGKASMSDLSGLNENGVVCVVAPKLQVSDHLRSGTSEHTHVPNLLLYPVHVGKKPTPILWFTDFDFQSMPTPLPSPTRGYRGLLLRSDAGVIHSVSTPIIEGRVLDSHECVTASVFETSRKEDGPAAPTLLTGSLGLWVFGSFSLDPDSFEGFNEGRVLGTHGRGRAPSWTEFRRRRGLDAR